jgi:hypothetical protein
MRFGNPLPDRLCRFQRASRCRSIASSSIRARCFLVVRSVRLAWAMMVRTVFKPKLVSSAIWRSDMGGLSNLCPSLTMSAPYRLTNERLYVEAAVAQLQDTRHLGGTGGERPADVARRLGVGDVPVSITHQGVEPGDQDIVLVDYLGVFVPEGFPGPAIVGGQFHIERLAPAFGDDAAFLDVLAQAVLRLAQLVHFIFQFGDPLVAAFEPILQFADALVLVNAPCFCVHIIAISARSFSIATGISTVLGVSKTGLKTAPDAGAVLIYAAAGRSLGEARITPPHMSRAAKDLFVPKRRTLGLSLCFFLPKIASGRLTG